MPIEIPHPFFFFTFTSAGGGADHEMIRSLSSVSTLRSRASHSAKWSTVSMAEEG